MIDHKVELNLSIQDINSSTIKDDLFELIMLRFEEMQIYKNSLKMIIRSTKDKPILLTQISKNIFNTLDFYLEVARGYDKSILDVFKKIFCF